MHVLYLRDQIICCGKANGAPLEGTEVVTPSPCARGMVITLRVCARGKVIGRVVVVVIVVVSTKIAISQDIGI